MRYLRRLAVHKPISPDDLRAKRLANRLVAQANTQNRHFARGSELNCCQADASLLWIARSGTN